MSPRNSAAWSMITPASQTALPWLVCAWFLSVAGACAESPAWKEYQVKAEAAADSGRLNEAVETFKLAVSEAEKPSAKPQDLAASLNGMASVYTRLGNPDYAAELYRRSLRALERGLGVNDPALIQTLLDLGSVYEAEGNHSGAMALYNRVFAISEKKLGPWHPEVARSLHRIAVIHSQQGRQSQAEDEFKRAISIMDKAVGPVKADLESLHADYADHLKRADRMSEAAHIEQRAKDIRAQQKEPNAPLTTSASTAPGRSLEAPSPARDHSPVAASTARVGNQSAWNAQLTLQQKSVQQAQVDEAQRLLDQAQASGTPEQQLSPMFSTLADVYDKQSRYADSEPLYKQAIAIDEKTLGPNHPGLAADLNNLAILYIAQGRYGDAEPLLKRALSIYKDVYGEDNLLYIKCQSDLASAYEHAGNNAQAEALYRNALALSQKLLGPNHIETARLLNCLAFVCYSQNKFAEAETLYKWALASSEAALPPNSPLLAACMEDYSKVLRRLNKIAEAEQLETRAKTILANQSQPDG